MRMEGRTSSRDMLTIGAGLAGCNRTEVFYGVSFNLRHRRSGTGGAAPGAATIVILDHQVRIIVQPEAIYRTVKHL